MIDRLLLLAANVIIAVSDWIGRWDEIGCVPWDGDDE